MLKAVKTLSVFLVATTLLSCSAMIRNATESLVGGVMQQNDMRLIEDGAPAYLLIIESLIYNNPENKDFLMAGIQTFSSYSSFIKDDKRKKIFQEKVKKWGNMLLATYPTYLKYEQTADDDKEAKNNAYTKFVSSIKKKDIPYVFWGFLGNISDSVSDGLSDPSLFLILPRVIELAQRIYELDDTFMDGMPHLIFGIYNCVYPEAYGGSFEKGKEELDKAIKISGGKNLLYKVLYAEFYFKPLYDREGYEKLMNEVVNFDLEIHPEGRIINSRAQEQAKSCLEHIDEVFF